MKIKLYSYNNCGTCKKAIKFLNDKSLTYELIDITKKPPTLEELEVVLSGMEGNLKKLFNTSGVAYRSGGYSELLKTMTEQDALGHLAKNGRLIKRPLILREKEGICGFKSDQWELFLSRNVKFK